MDSSSIHPVSQLCYFILDKSASLPPELRPLIMATITMLAMVRARKIVIRKMSIFLDCRYMAYNRAIMMTDMIF